MVLSQSWAKNPGSVIPNDKLGRISLFQPMFCWVIGNLCCFKKSETRSNVSRLICQSSVTHGIAGIYRISTVLCSQQVGAKQELIHRTHGAGIYANNWGILMVNVTVYSSTMDPSWDMYRGLSSSQQLLFGRAPRKKSWELPFPLFRSQSMWPFRMPRQTHIQKLCPAITSCDHQRQSNHHIFYCLKIGYTDIG